MADDRLRIISRRDILRRAGIVGAAAVAGPAHVLGAAAAPATAEPIAQAASSAAPAREAFENLTVDGGRPARSDRRAADSDRRARPRRAQKRARRTTSIARSAARSPSSRQAYASGLAALDRLRDLVARQAVSPSCRPTDQDSVLDRRRDRRSHRVRRQLRRSSSRWSSTTRAGHVRRSLLRRQRQLRRLGSASAIRASARW